MARKRTPRRPRKFRPMYSHIDVLMASAVNPMPEKTRQSWLTRILLALRNIESGDRPGEDDWRILSDAVNLAETMIGHGIVSDDDGIKTTGLHAMALAGARYLDGKPMRLSGEGIQAMRALVEDMGELMATMPHRDIVRVHIATEKRIADVVAGRKQAGDVVVAL